MNLRKRVILSVIGGVVCAIICTVGKIKLNPAIPLPELFASAVFNRILLGFVIGISRLRMNYLLHGAFIGLIVTLAYSLSMLPEKEEGFVIYTTVGVIYGILIELFIARFANDEKNHQLKEMVG